MGSAAHGLTGYDLLWSTLENHANSWTQRTLPEYRQRQRLITRGIRQAPPPRFSRARVPNVSAANTSLPPAAQATESIPPPTVYPDVHWVVDFGDGENAVQTSANTPPIDAEVTEETPIEHDDQTAQHQNPLARTLTSANEINIAADNVQADSSSQHGFDDAIGSDEIGETGLDAINPNEQATADQSSTSATVTATATTAATTSNASTIHGSQIVYIPLFNAAIYLPSPITTLSLKDTTALLLLARQRGRTVNPWTRRWSITPISPGHYALYFDGKLIVGVTLIQLATSTAPPKKHCIFGCRRQNMFWLGSDT